MYNRSLLIPVALREKMDVWKPSWSETLLRSPATSIHLVGDRGETLQPTTSHPCTSTWWLKYSFLLKQEANKACPFYLVLHSIIALDFMSRQQHYCEISISMGSHYKGSPQPSLRKAVQWSPVKTSFPASAVLSVERILYPENIFS